MEADYTKRELDQHFKDLGDKMDNNTRITEALDKKVGIQNGRVGKLETKWGAVVLGCSICLVLMGTIVGLVIYSFNLSLQNLRQQILLEINNK